jgi:hypothetical protein
VWLLIFQNAEAQGEGLGFSDGWSECHPGKIRQEALTSEDL